MSTITIPPAVVEAVAVAEWDAERARIVDFTLPLFDELHPEVKKLKLENARTACLAMLTAWPGAHGANQIGGVTTPLTLPFPPQENPDDQ